MNNNDHVTGQQYIMRMSALLFICFMSTSVVAGVSLPSPDEISGTENFVDLEKTEIALDPVRTVPEQLRTSGTVEDAVIVQDEALQTQLISAAFTPSDMGFSQRAGAGDPVQEISGNAGSSPMPVTTARSERRQMSYALVLTLIALIGLVPVSRRNH